MKTRPVLILHSAMSRTEMLPDAFALVDLMAPFDHSLPTIRASYRPIFTQPSVDNKKLCSILLSGQMLEGIGHIETSANTM